TAIMNRAFERLSPAVERSGETLARRMGDALLAFFGASLFLPHDQANKGVHFVRRAIHFPRCVHIAEWLDDEIHANNVVAQRLGVSVAPTRRDSHNRR